MLGKKLWLDGLALSKLLLAALVLLAFQIEDKQISR